MARTSSAVPADLLAFERSSQSGASELGLAASTVSRAGAALADARSVGLERIDLGTLGRRLRHHGERIAALADHVGDVAHAFALAGGGSAGQQVTIDERFLAASRLLPGGRAVTLAELEAMTYAERLRWFDEFLSSDVVPDDPNFRAVAGVLAAAHAAGPGGLWDDDAFRLADAALLESMQLGLLVAASGGAWRAAPGDPRSRAVAAWVDYASTVGDESERDAAWAFGEEQSVRYGEALADAAGLRFGPALEDFIRFSHVYRAAIHRQADVALLATISSSLDADGLARLLDDVSDVLWGRVQALIDLPGPIDELITGVLGQFDPFDVVDDALRLPIGPSLPPIDIVIDTLVRNFAPEAIAAMMLDPSSTPPDLVQSVLDDVLGVPPPMADPPASYYVGLLTDHGYLVGLPTELGEIPRAVPRLPGE